MRHLENMAKVMLATGMIVGLRLPDGGLHGLVRRATRTSSVQMLKNRPFGPYAHTYWMMIACNVVDRRSSSGSARCGATSWLLWFLAIFVNIGMWLERYVIVVTSLHRDFLPSSWSMYHGTFWDYATYYGTIGLFLSLMFLFIRFLPVISITEMRELVHETQEHQERHGEPAAATRGDRAMKVAQRPDGPVRADGRVRPSGGRWSRRPGTPTSGATG